MTPSRKMSRWHRISQDVCVRGRQAQCGRDLLFRDIKQAREEQDLRTMKMLWINPILKCCNPERQKLKATPVSLWEGSMENECPGEWLWDSVAWPRNWGPHLWARDCKARSPRML